MLHMTTGLVLGVKKMGGTLEWGKCGERAQDHPPVVNIRSNSELTNPACSVLTFVWPARHTADWLVLVFSAPLKTASHSSVPGIGPSAKAPNAMVALTLP